MHKTVATALSSFRESDGHTAMKPYLVMSDVHLHDWSAFSQVDNGVNTRLKIILREIVRAAGHLKKHGGDKIVITGDLFHVRGKLAPSVLNPVTDVFRRLVESGFEIHALPGLSLIHI